MLPLGRATKTKGQSPFANMSGYVLAEACIVKGQAIEAYHAEERENSSLHSGGRRAARSRVLMSERLG